MQDITNGSPPYLAAGPSPGCSSIISAGEKSDTDSYCAYMEWTIGSIDAEKSPKIEDSRCRVS